MNETVTADAPVPAEEGGAKERIVNCAVKLFCEKGFHATSVREIVEAAGVTKPVLYYYFKNKDALLAYLLEDSMTRFLKQIAAICDCEGDSLETSIQRIAEAYVEWARRWPENVRFINAIVFSGQYDHIYDFIECMKELFGSIVKIFERAKARGELREDLQTQTMAVHLVGMARMMIDGIIYMPELTEGKPLAQNIVKILLDGISNRAGDTAREQEEVAQ